MTPFFTALGGYLLFNQRFDYKFLIGAYLLAIEKLRTQLTLTTILTWVCRIVTLFLTLILFISNDEWFPHSWNGWLNVIGLALTLIFADGLLAYSLKHLSSSLVAMINLLDPDII